MFLISHFQSNAWFFHYILVVSLPFHVGSVRVGTVLHLQGNEPGPSAWQASTLPLNHRCKRIQYTVSETFINYSNNNGKALNLATGLYIDHLFINVPCVFIAVVLPLIGMIRRVQWPHVNVVIREYFGDVVCKHYRAHCFHPNAHITPSPPLPPTPSPSLESPSAWWQPIVRSCLTLIHTKSSSLTDVYMSTYEV